MTDLKDQLRLEDDLVLQGADRFNKGTTQAEDSGRGSDTGYGQRLLRTLIQPVAEGVTEFCEDGARKHGKYKKIIKPMNAEVLAYVALKTVLDSLHRSPSVTSLAMDIGLRIEDEQRFSAFRDMNPAYYSALIKDFQKKHTKAYRHMRNVLAVTSKKKGLKWDGWTKDARLHIGTVLLDRILERTDIIKITLARKSSKGKQRIYKVSATASAIEWIEGYNQYASMLHPYTKPCVIKPDDWTGIRNGGYWSELMRHRVPLIIGLSKSEEKFVADHDMRQVFDAVNAIQSTKWTINKQVLSVMQHAWRNDIEVGLPSKSPIEIPVFRVDTKPKDMDETLLKEFVAWKGEVAQMYTDEIGRSSRAFEVARTVSMAAAYSEYEDIYFVYQCDFRGRLYASSSGLSPQGSEYNKALLKFSDGVALGERGLYWLAVHGANCYGVDKLPFDDRVKWVNDNLNMIQRIKNDPIRNASDWAEADKPFMFLAFCLEYAEAVFDPEDFISYLPIGMDGSCNGLQNFSALLRDSVGGKATNLLPGDTPADIYAEVAGKSAELIKEAEDCPMKNEWIRFMQLYDGTIPRDVAKRPVMTLPYGCTRYSCFEFIYDAVRSLQPTFFSDLNKASAYLTDFLWKAMEQTVIAAADTMEWLQVLADRMAKKNLPVWWVNPVGFPVYQSNKKTSSKRIRSVLMGDIHLSLTVDTNIISPQRQKQGIAPNFVHSLDSAHMMFTTNCSEEKGIKSFAMIHDDFGTHAGNTEEFRDTIRQTFVNMYKNSEPLHDLYVSCALILETGDLPAVPEYGTLDLDDILDSEYFFG